MGSPPPPRAGHDVGRVSRAGKRVEMRVEMRRPGKKRLELASLQKPSEQPALQWEHNVETSFGLIDDVRPRRGDDPLNPQTGSVMSLYSQYCSNKWVRKDQ